MLCSPWSSPHDQHIPAHHGKEGCGWQGRGEAQPWAGGCLQSPTCPGNRDAQLLTLPHTAPGCPSANTSWELGTSSLCAFAGGWEQRACAGGKSRIPREGLWDGSPAPNHIGVAPTERSPVGCSMGCSLTDKDTTLDMVSDTKGTRWSPQKLRTRMGETHQSFVAPWGEPQPSQQHLRLPTPEPSALDPQVPNEYFRF